MKRSRVRRHGSAIARGLRRAVLLVVVCLFLSILYLCTLGLPSTLLRRLEVHLSSDRYAVEMRSATVLPLSGIVVEDLRLFPRGVIGPAACEFERLVISVHWLHLFGEGLPVRAISAEEGAVRPALFHARCVDETSRFPNADFDLVLSRVEVADVMIDQLSTRASSRADAIKLDALDATVSREGRQGRLEGSVSCGNNGALRFDLDAVCDPAIFLPIMDARKMIATGRMIRSMELSEVAPRWHMTLERGPGRQADFALHAECRIEDLAYRGVPLLRADMRFHIEGGPSNLVSNVERILLVREEGVLLGDCSMRTTSAQKQFEYDINSAIHPEALAQIIGIMTNQVSDLLFEAPYKITSRGCVDFMNAAKTEATGEVTFGALKRGLLKLDQCRFDFRANGPTTLVENVRGEWCGGAVEGEYVRVRAHETMTNEHFRLSFRVRDADFNTLVESVLVRKDKEQTGRFSGRLDLSGEPGTGHVNSLIGKGSVRIKDARLFRMPLFGGFTRRVVAVVPGLDLVLRPSDVSANFEIRDAAVHTDELLIDGRLLSLSADGKYWFDGRLRFNVELKFLKSKTFAADIIRLATYPLTKLFKFKLRGTREKPEWETVNF